MKSYWLKKSIERAKAYKHTPGYHIVVTSFTFEEQPRTPGHICEYYEYDDTKTENFPGVPLCALHKTYIGVERELYWKPVGYTRNWNASGFKLCIYRADQRGFPTCPDCERLIEHHGVQVSMPPKVTAQVFKVLK